MSAFGNQYIEAVASLQITADVTEDESAPVQSDQIKCFQTQRSPGCAEVESTRDGT